jgi:hypothetical protein
MNYRVWVKYDTEAARFSCDADSFEEAINTLSNLIKCCSFYGGIDPYGGVEKYEPLDQEWLSVEEEEIQYES